MRVRRDHRAQRPAHAEAAFDVRLRCYLHWAPPLRGPTVVTCTGTLPEEHIPSDRRVQCAFAEKGGQVAAKRTIELHAANIQRGASADMRMGRGLEIAHKTQHIAFYVALNQQVTIKTAHVAVHLS